MKNVHLKNIFINWGGHTLSLVVMFFLSPYIVGKLDAVSYGIWSLVSVLVGYMGLFDIGVRSSVGRYVALYIGKADRKGVDETIRTGFGFFTLAGGIIFFVGVVFGWFFPVFFKSISAEHYNTVKYLLPFMALNVWLSVVSAVYSSVITAHSRFDIARGTDLIVLLIRTSSTIYALHIGMGLWGLACSIMLGNFVSLILNRIFAGIINKGLRSFPLLFSRSRLREILGYGVYAFISSVSYKIIGQTDLIIVGIFLSVADVREYSVGAMLVLYSYPFVSMVSRTYFPAVQRKVSGGTIDEVKSLFYDQVRISLCFGLVIYIGIAFYSKSFIGLWMLQDGFDSNSVAKSAVVMTILSISKLPSLYISPCLSILSAMGHVRFNANRAIIESIVNVLFSLFFVIWMNLGLAGVAAGTLVSHVLVGTISVPIYLCIKAEISAKEFLSRVISPGILAGGLFSFVCFFQIEIWQPTAWVEFLIHVVICLNIWFLISFFILFPVETRNKIYSFWLSLLNVKA